MSRVLLAWEMGDGLGHIDRQLVLAQALRKRGHEVWFALRDLSMAHQRLVSAGFRVLQAPFQHRPLVDPPRLVNHAAVLAAAGWLDPAGLAGRVAAWRGLFELVGCETLVCDHAPTAMLAARGGALRVWAIGSSFEVPPAGDFFAPMHFWDPSESARCPMYDHQLLVPANKALALLGESPLPRLTALYSGVQRALVSLPELCQYAGYTADTPVVGPVFVDDRGEAPDWPAGDGPRVLGYLFLGDPRLPAVIDALNAVALPTLLLLRGAGTADLSRMAQLDRLAGPMLRLVRRPLRLDRVMGDVTLVLSHGSMGMTSAAALAGCPQLLLPAQTEQTMTSQRALDLGMALVLPLSASTHDVRTALLRLLNEPAFQANADALAQRHQGHSPQRTGEALADLVEGRPVSPSSTGRSPS